MKLIQNIPAFKLTDTRGRPVIDGTTRQPVMESMASFLLTLAGDPGFIKGFDFIQSAAYVKGFCSHVTAQSAATNIELDGDAHERIVAVLRAPRARIESTTLHCYHDLIQAILNATDAEPEPLAHAAE